MQKVGFEANLQEITSLGKETTDVGKVGFFLSSKSLAIVSNP